MSVTQGDGRGRPGGAGHDGTRVGKRRSKKRPPSRRHVRTRRFGVPREASRGGGGRRLAGEFIFIFVCMGNLYDVVFFKQGGGVDETGARKLVGHPLAFVKVKPPYVDVPGDFSAPRHQKGMTPGVSPIPIAAMAKLGMTSSETKRSAGKTKRSVGKTKRRTTRPRRRRFLLPVRVTRRRRRMAGKSTRASRLRSRRARPCTAKTRVFGD